MEDGIQQMASYTADDSMEMAQSELRYYDECATRNADVLGLQVLL